MTYWTTNPPTAPGLYWFYGFTNGRHDNDYEKPGWHLCEAWSTTDGVIMMKMGGVFSWDRDPLVGHFCKVNLPKLPVDAQTTNVPK
jgi:hypothetical protein